MKKLPSKVLIIDRDETVLNHVENMLAKLKISVLKANNWEQGIYHFNQNRVDLVISDKNLEEITGPILVQKIRCHQVPSKRNPGLIITQSTALNPSDEQLLKELGEVVVITKPIKEATLISFILKAMDAADSRAKVHELKINVLEPLINKGDAQKAAKVAEEKLMDGGPKSRFVASEVFECAERFNKSLSVTGSLLQNDPKNLQYINQLARLKMKTGDLEDSRRYYEIADNLASENLERIEQMAQLYLDMKLPQKSIEKFKLLIKNNPESPDLKFDFFSRVQKAGFEKEAQQFFQDTSTAKELIKHFNNKGVMLSKQGLYQDAIDEYDKARRLIPKSKELYRILYNMAIAHINLKTKGNIETADELLRQVISIKPDYEKAHDKIKLTEKYLKKSA